MAKRQIEFDDKIIKFAVWAIGVVFTAYLAIDSWYIDSTELELDQAEQASAYESIEEDLQTRILMSESTRYAQVAKYYRDELKKRSLTEAEQARLDLVEREQCRIRNELVDGNEICN